MSLRVCLISLEVFAWGRYGGIGRATRDIAEGLARRGYDVHVVTPRYPGQRTLEELDGFTVHGHSIYGYPFTGPTYRGIDADIYHSQEPGLGTLTAMNSVSGALHIVTCQNPRTKEDWEHQQRYYGLRRQAYNRFMEPKVGEAVRRADAVFCQSRHIIRKTKELYRLEDDPGFLPNPVDIPENIPRKASEPTVCFLGRLDPEKSPERFIAFTRASP
ncbi:MAG: glycosyltransferase family 4 protein, partial [Candidatus Bathyarchaeota archaeon]